MVTQSDLGQAIAEVVLYYINSCVKLAYKNTDAFPNTGFIYIIFKNAVLKLFILSLWLIKKDIFLKRHQK